MIRWKRQHSSRLLLLFSVLYPFIYVHHKVLKRFSDVSGIQRRRLHKERALVSGILAASFCFHDPEMLEVRFVADNDHGQV